MISPAPPVTTGTVKAETAKTQQINEPLFYIELPADWKLANKQTTPTTTYTWQSTDTKRAGRSITFYLDSVPSGLGVNRALSVQAAGNKISAVGDVSDNCASFTSPNSTEQLVATPAKWGGQPFLCDLANYNRDVVGIVSADGLNKVNVNSESGTHSLFFTYTDNNIQPDFSIFIIALQSFQLK
ncbi:MAG TPA: hypothetical protein VFI84_02940 [Candidatus Saccharimonadales bacterium]|nr:hypothetical protein [Candidatus Saccharimonadales bacterium]